MTFSKFILVLAATIALVSFACLFAFLPARSDHSPLTAVYGTHRVLMNNNPGVVVYQWYTEDGLVCGTMSHGFLAEDGPAWRVFQLGGPRATYYDTQEEAEKFITKWCRP